jgi:hypothetical protein
MSDQRPRSVLTVIRQLIEVIPKNENEAKLIQELDEYANGLWNIAPELLETAAYWRPLANILGKHIVEIDTEWKKTMVKIHNNETDSPAPEPHRSGPEDEKTYYHPLHSLHAHGEENQTQRTLAALGMCLPPR